MTSFRAASLPVLFLCLVLLVEARTFVKLGDGQCNGGVGGSGEFKCLVGGSCNEGGTPLKPPTETGTGCPGPNEYLACDETDKDEAACRAACTADAGCLGFMISKKQIGGGKCELHTKAVEFASKPLECYNYNGSAFVFLGFGACRTKEITTSGPKPGTHYGDYSITWADSLAACKSACSSSQGCIGIEFAQTPRAEGGHKCELHVQELSQERMVVFACWVPESDNPQSTSSAMSGHGHVSLSVAASLPLLVSWLERSAR